MPSLSNILADQGTLILLSPDLPKLPWYRRRVLLVQCVCTASTIGLYLLYKRFVPRPLWLFFHAIGLCFVNMECNATL